jgi:hypothetical protein
MQPTPSVRLLAVSLCLAGCTAEFRTLLPNGDVAPQPEVITLLDDKVITLKEETFMRGNTIISTTAREAKFELRVPGEAIAIGFQVTGSTAAAFQVGEWRDGDRHLMADSLVNLGGVSAEMDPMKAASNYTRCAGCDNPTVFNQVTLATLAPNNPKGKFAPGTHDISLLGQAWKSVTLGDGYVVPFVENAPATGSVYVSAFAKVTPKLPDTGVVDLNMHYTGAQGWRASNAEENPGITAMLERLNTILSPAGLRIGVVRHFDVDEEFAMLADTGLPTADSAMHAMRRSGTDSAGVSLFFVGEVVGFGGLYGVASGIPGPYINGTEVGGVTVALDRHVAASVLDPDAVARTVAHEMGHELGLFHTLEYSGDTDPLDDTNDSCEWVMYASPVCLVDSSMPGTKFSPEQGRVLRRNMHVYHQADEGGDL